MTPNDQFKPTIVVIICGEGKVTSRELEPALPNLSRSRGLPAVFSVIVVDRVQLSDDTRRRRFHAGVKQFSRHGTVNTDGFRARAGDREPADLQVRLGEVPTGKVCSTQTAMNASRGAARMKRKASYV